MPLEIICHHLPAQTGVDQFYVYCVAMSLLKIVGMTTENDLVQVGQHARTICLSFRLLAEETKNEDLSGRKQQYLRRSFTFGEELVGDSQTNNNGLHHMGMNHFCEKRATST